MSARVATSGLLASHRSQCTVKINTSAFTPGMKASAMRARRTSVKREVVAEANLFSRIFRLARSTVNNVVSQAEDPEKLLDQVVSDMQDDVIRMRQASAQAMAASKQLEKKYSSAQATADEWYRRAELALQKGDEELAREALSRKKAFQGQADQLKQQFAAQKQAVDGLITNTRAIEAKLEEAKAKKETLKARAASAKTAKVVGEMIGSLDTSSSVAAFDKMEEKVMSLEAEAESIGQLVAPDNLEKKFQQLEGGTVDDELSKMKKGMLGSGRPKAQLPEGSRKLDDIDFELEELRRKARE